MQQSILAASSGSSFAAASCSCRQNPGPISPALRLITGRSPGKSGTKPTLAPANQR